MESVKLFVAGDFCSKPSTSNIVVSDELKSLIQSCDLKIVNFEVPLKPEVNLLTQSRERFFQNDDAPDFLSDLGFNLFSIANNHAFDWGDEGYKKTKEVLGDGAFGAGNYEEAYKVKVVEVNGLKIGFMGLSYAAYSGVFDDVTNHEGLGCAYINDLRVNHDIIEAKKRMDYLFVLPHDGIEYIDVPLPETIARYRDFIDYGADGVIASHPHRPQGWETYKDKPIFYSLGNFLFNSKDGYDNRAINYPHWYEGIAVVLNIFDRKMTWEVVNTRNVNNVGIEIDHDASRNDDNNKLCYYLKDNSVYNDYLLPLLKEQSDVDLRRVKRMFLPQSNKEILKMLWNSLRRKKPVSKKELHYLLKNDLTRTRFVRSLLNDFR